MRLICSRMRFENIPVLDAFLEGNMVLKKFFE